ncbi:hypothetical protein CERSUDRAFT_57267, partial [Gelatoporia subvermispora B]
KEAIQNKLVKLEEAGTWKLVEKLTEVNIVGSKWVLRKKKNTTGEIKKYKALLIM